jgi:polyisoprenoid-binding protein YceI
MMKTYPSTSVPSAGRVTRFASLGPIIAMILICLAAGSAMAAGTWEFDKAHSSATFQIRHMFSPVTGRFTDFAGTIVFDQDNPEKSSVELTIQAATINTDNGMRDKHLCSPDFFNVEKFPTLTFKSTKIEKTDQKNVYKVTGDLDMVGVSKPVVLSVEVLGSGPDPFNPKGERAGFVATTTINRQDWGLKWNKVLDKGNTLLSDEVKITFPVEAVLKAS